jgi:REP element-mobilizing transposase RayT
MEVIKMGYRSWYIVDEKYLYDLFRYIEHNPIEAKIANKIGEYPFTLPSLSPP